MTVKTTSKTEINESKEEQLNQQETLGERERNPSPKDGVERTKTVSYYLTGTLMDRATIGQACSRTAGQRSIAGTASKLADKTEATQGRRPGRTTRL